MPQSLRICHWGKDKGEKWKTGQIEENWILERCPQTAGCRNLPLSAARSSPQSASLCRQLLLPHMSWGHLPWTLPAYLFRQQTLTSFALLCDQSAAKMDVHLIWIFITLQTNAHQKNHIWLSYSILLSLSADTTETIVLIRVNGNYQRTLGFTEAYRQKIIKNQKSRTCESGNMKGITTVRGLWAQLAMTTPPTLSWCPVTMRPQQAPWLQYSGPFISR